MCVSIFIPVWLNNELYAASNPTYSLVACNLDFIWRLFVADVHKPIISVDFLHFNNLLDDVHHQNLDKYSP